MPPMQAAPAADGGVVSEPRRLNIVRPERPTRVRPEPQLCEHGNPAGWLDSNKNNLICGECRRAEAERERTS